MDMYWKILVVSLYLQQYTGELIGAGWSASMGYPGIKLDSDGDTVHGFLFYSHNLEDNWEYLDEFEGEEFVRTEVTCRTI